MSNRNSLIPFIFGYLCFAVFIINSTLMAQTITPSFSFEKFVTFSDTLPYRLYSPVVKSEALLPMVVFLHGAGERGDDNEKQLLNGVKNFLPISKFTSNEAIVVVPQCAEDYRWCEVPWSAASHQRPIQISKYLGLVSQLIDTFLISGKIDKRRVYVVGLSMGGFGVWDLIARYPSKFAAAVPICGGGDESDAQNLTNIPIWAFHGANDKVVLPERSIRMIKAIEQSGGNPLLTIYPTVGHDSWNLALSNPELYTWLFRQVLK